MAARLFREEPSEGRYQGLSVKHAECSMTLTFDRGHLIFLEPVISFWGQGALVAVAPEKIEKQQLNLLTGSPTERTPGL